MTEEDGLATSPTGGEGQKPCCDCTQIGCCLKSRTKEQPV